MIEYSWQDLDYEIKSNLDANLPVEFWWRNDDTAYHVNKLKPLAALAKNEGVAVGISTVPKLLTECAKTYILQITNANVLQHGYNHTNHATESERKEELGAHRNTNEVLTELLSGQDKLKLAFDKKLLPVLVPPWNKIETTIVNELPNLGYKGLSCFGSRTRTKNER